MVGWNEGDGPINEGVRVGGRTKKLGIVVGVAVGAFAIGDSAIGGVLGGIGTGMKE